MKNDSRPEKTEEGRKTRLFRFELSPFRLGLYSCCLVLALCWMFAFGILVGRGIPLVSLDDVTLRARLMKFVGLARQPAPPVDNAADTWDPQAVLKSLDYYENLTGKDSGANPSDHQPPAGAAPRSKEAATQKPKPPAQQSGSPATAENARSDTEKPLRDAPRDVPPTTRGEEHFTLLVMSLRDAPNAHKMVEQLKSKGYSPRLENLDLNNGGRWNRVLVGSFGSREEALRFAAEFNRKEHMEGLVIRENQ
jgi:cell division septation protein DedD